MEDVQHLIRGLGSSDPEVRMKAAKRLAYMADEHEENRGESIQKALPALMDTIRNRTRRYNDHANENRWTKKYAAQALTHHYISQKNL